MEERNLKSNSLYFHPERVVKIGVLVLALGLALCLPLIILHGMQAEPSSFYTRPLLGEKEEQNLSFSLGLSDNLPILPVPKIQEELVFSLDPPRPEAVNDKEYLIVRVRKSSECKRVVLPCKLDLEFQKDKLKFAAHRSPLWIALRSMGDGQVEAKWTIDLLGEEKNSSGSFVAKIEESPVLSALELPEGSPFKSLAEAKWLGKDLFKKEELERVEVGPNEYVDVGHGSWLVWKGQKWEVGHSPLQGAPVARIESSSPKGLVLEGWDSKGYMRILVPPGSVSSFKVKGEELFSSLRIRSEKQISCVLEKQCLVLKSGDWVLKTGGRWKILRKKEEREAFLHGKLLGELFIFDQISQKQGQKMVQGRIFPSSRTQVAHLEMAAQSARTAKERRSSKGGKG